MIPTTQLQVEAIAIRLARVDTIAVDTETTGFHTWQNDVLRGISVAYYAGTHPHDWYIPVSHPDSRNFDPAPIFRALKVTDALVCMHNAPFDIGVLDKAGCSFVKPGRLYDTQVGDWLIDENKDHRLKDGLGVRYFGADAKAEKEHLDGIRSDTGRDWDTFTADDIGAYAAKDAELTLLAHDYQMSVIPDMKDSPLADITRENKLQLVLAKMMKTGIAVDEERAERQYQEQLAERDRLAEHFATIQIGGRDKPGVNMNSPQQLATLIYDEWELDCYLRTPGGKRSTSKEALEPHAEVDQRIAEVLAHRRADKACAGFYEPLARYAGADGRVHASFSSARTVTGRLTCSEPNMQTIPRADVLAGIRACIVPREGFELWEYDLDSAELRIIGAVTREPALFEAMAEGRDLHAETAASVFGPEYTGVQRRLAKNMNYGYPYYIGADKLARYLAAGPPRRPMSPALIAEAKRMKARYARTYPRMTAMMGALSDAAREAGYLPLTKPGRFRRFKTMRTKRGEPKYYTALNAIVQGAVAELMKDVMLDFDGNVAGIMCLQVHDSLVVEVPPGTGEVVHQQLQRIVDDHNPFPKMPMPISAKVWGT